VSRVNRVNRVNRAQIPFWIFLDFFGFVAGDARPMGRRSRVIHACRSPVVWAMGHDRLLLGPKKKSFGHSVTQSLSHSVTQSLSHSFLFFFFRGLMRGKTKNNAVAESAESAETDDETSEAAKAAKAASGCRQPRVAERPQRPRRPRRRHIFWHTDFDSCVPGRIDRSGKSGKSGRLFPR
jgi:hypothetical protein